ncbi:hypothetical protein ABBQ32_010416 [Trebouxia sp. C0010 RCD-2024]
MDDKFKAAMSRALQGVSFSFDTWTDLSYNQLMAFAAFTSEMPRQIYTHKAVDVTTSANTGDKTFEHLKEEIELLKNAEEAPCDCCWRGCQGSLLAERALCAYGLLQDKQRCVHGKTSGLTLPVVTRRGSHYNAIKQLLQSQQVMNLLVLEKRGKLLKSVGSKNPAKGKAERCWTWHVTPVSGQH